MALEGADAVLYLAATRGSVQDLVRKHVPPQRQLELRSTSGGTDERVRWPLC